MLTKLYCAGLFFVSVITEVFMLIRLEVENCRIRYERTGDDMDTLLITQKVKPDSSHLSVAFAH